ncbi:MAG: hypothetical protein EA352_06205 [Gemmatimonadales bacterium]|nr:MAG: hypothetical protein EA352_06205 [Gemmatimonadales bacterium]
MTPTVLLAFLALLVVLTLIHEAGHALAVRSRGGRILRIRLGRGIRVARSPQREDGPQWVLALPPFGGRITYEGIPEGTPQAVVAVAGPAANAVAAWLAFALAGIMAPDPSVLPGAGELDSLTFASASMAAWFALVPAALVELVAEGGVDELRQALALLPQVLSGGGLAGLLYVTGAGSALWAVLNLVPVPVVGTDGWHVLRSLGAAVRSRREVSP